MSREQILKARADGNAALVEAMLLAAISDGNISQAELQQLLLRMIERPEFDGMLPEDANALVEASAEKLSRITDMKEVLASLRERLPDHHSRLVAFALAAAVAFVDKRATREELGLLKTFQAGLGISEEEVIRVIDVVESGGNLADVIGDPVERLYAEVMVLMTAADGEVKPQEAAALVQTFAADPLFEGVSPAQAEDLISDSVAALREEGLPQRIAMLARGLSSRQNRLRAYTLAVRIASANDSGEIKAPEARVLELLQTSFGLADDEVQRIEQQS